MAKKTKQETDTSNAAGKGVTRQSSAKKGKKTKSATAKKQSKKVTGKGTKSSKGITEKAMKALIAQGKKQGFLTYDEINTALPDEMLAGEQMDETLLMFDDLGIDIIDGNNKNITKAKAKKAVTATKASESAMPDYGSVTDPVKMYLREMGLVTLLSREGEVEIAKKIEAGEQDVLKALLETTIGVDFILDLGRRIENLLLRPKHVLRDVDEGAIHTRMSSCRLSPS